MTLPLSRRRFLKSSEKKVATQMGNQGHAGEGVRLWREWFDAGLLGRIPLVRASPEPSRGSRLAITSPNGYAPVKGGRPAGSNFAYAAPLTEICLLGALALRTGRRIDWDGAAMRIVNLPEANSLLTKEYRPGFGV